MTSHILKLGQKTRSSNNLGVVVSSSDVLECSKLLLFSRMCLCISDFREALCSVVTDHVLLFKIESFMLKPIPCRFKSLASTLCENCLLPCGLNIGTYFMSFLYQRLVNVCIKNASKQDTSLRLCIFNQVYELSDTLEECVYAHGVTEPLLIKTINSRH